jgi:molybdopterin synthase sulfur carrier subunit
MRVHVVFLGRASDIAGINLLELDIEEGATLRDLIKIIGERVNPVLAERYFKGHYIFVTYINGVPVENPNTKLKDGDRVVLITPEMGG